jgi:hypothetical protein
VCDAIRPKHHTYSTEKAFVCWSKGFVLYHNKRHPLETDEKGICEFVTYLVMEESAAASTQHKTLRALPFRHCEVLRKDLDLPVELVLPRDPIACPQT